MTKKLLIIFAAFVVTALAQAHDFGNLIIIRPGIYKNAQHTVVVKRLDYLKDKPGWFTFSIDSMQTIYFNELTGVAGMMLDPKPTYGHVMDRPFDLTGLTQANDITHFEFRQGGTMQAIDRKVDIYLHSRTGDLVRIDYDMKIARFSLPPWILRGLHSGPLKSSHAFDTYHCDNLLRSFAGSGNFNEWFKPGAYDGAVTPDDL